MKQQFRRIRARTVSGVVAAVFAANAWAVDPFTVRDIRVEGLQRVEPGTVFASLPFRVGDQYNDEKGSAAIRARCSRSACSRTCAWKSTTACWWSSSRNGPPSPTSTSSASRNSTRTCCARRCATSA
jgi:hypothetical protein